jgi:pimeloyl-ACP methyl ester carboxylesterase
VRVLASIPGSGLIAPGLLRAGSRLIGPALRSTYHDRALVTADVVRGYREPLLVPGVMEALWAMSRERTEPSDTVVADIRQPHLVITGDNDRWTNLPATDAGVHVEIARCGHLPHEEKPRQTATAILEFLDHLPD